MVGRAGRDGEPSETLLLASPSDAAALRRFAVVGRAERGRAAGGLPRAPESAGLVDPDEVAVVVPERDARVIVGMLEQAGLVRRGFDEGRLHARSSSRRAGRCTRAGRGAARPRGARRRVARRPRRRLRRDARLPPRAGRRPLRRDVLAPCGELRRVRAARHAARPRSRARRRRCPRTSASAIVDAVASLTWPLGRRSLIATLRGSLKAPPSARRSAAYRILAAASEAEVRRWVQAVESSGALVEVTTPDGFRVLHVDFVRTAAAHPDDDATPTSTRISSHACAAGALERSQEDAVPAYVVLHDATLRELAAVRPADPRRTRRREGVRPGEGRALRRRPAAVLATA